MSHRFPPTPPVPSAPRLPIEDLAIFVPSKEGRSGCGIQAGSAICGIPQEDGQLHLFYEGNIYGAVNLATFEERLNCAAGRLAQRYPTVAQIFTDASDFWVVGRCAYSTKLRSWVVTEINDPEVLAAWIAPEPLPGLGGSQELISRAVGLAASRLRGRWPQIAAEAQARGERMEDALLRHLDEAG